jgi:hypothetical protein
MGGRWNRLTSGDDSAPPVPACHLRPRGLIAEMDDARGMGEGLARTTPHTPKPRGGPRGPRRPREGTPGAGRRAPPTRSCADGRSAHPHAAPRRPQAQRPVASPWRHPRAAAATAVQTWGRPACAGAAETPPVRADTTRAAHGPPEGHDRGRAGRGGPGISPPAGAHSLPDHRPTPARPSGTTGQCVRLTVIEQHHRPLTL